MGLHSASKSWKRDEISALIALYETEHCLYDYNDEHFNDPVKQTESYGRIHEIMRRIRPTCTVGEIKYKINYLQRQYAGEVLNRNISVQAGLCTEESYKSSMWGFELLQFLNEFLPFMNDPKIDEPVETDVTVYYSKEKENGNKEPVDKASPEQRITNGAHTDVASSSDTVRENSILQDNTEERAPKKRKLNTSPTKRVSGSASAESSFDREDIFGQYVASEMKNLKDNPLLYLQTKQSILQILTSANFELINPE